MPRVNSHVTGNVLVTGVLELSEGSCCTREQDKLTILLTPGLLPDISVNGFVSRLTTGVVQSKMPGVSVALSSGTFKGAKIFLKVKFLFFVICAYMYCTQHCKLK